MTDHSQTTKPVRGDRTSGERPERGRTSRRTGDDPMSKLITVDFHDDTLFALDTPEGVFVAVNPICQRLGIDPQKQRKRIAEDAILSEGVCQAVYPSAGGGQETAGLRLDLIHGWLFTINEKLIRDDETRARVLTYKRECYGVLFQHFYGSRQQGPVVAPPPAAREEPVRVRRQLVTEARHVFGERAAGRLWFALGLPIVPEMQEPPKQGDFGFTYTAIPAQPAPARA